MRNERRGRRERERKKGKELIGSGPRFYCTDDQED